MIQRLLLNRIHLPRRRRAISQTKKFPALIHADETKSALPLPNMAVPRTQITMHAPIRHALPPSRFMQQFSFLQYFQILHNGISRGNLFIRKHFTTRQPNKSARKLVCPETPQRNGSRRLMSFVSLSLALTHPRFPSPIFKRKRTPHPPYFAMCVLI